MAFDCADEWAAKYRAETGQEPPVPAYFPGYAGAHTGNYTDQMVNSFSSTVDGAISAYQATQSSSSSGGGGGSALYRWRRWRRRGRWFLVTLCSTLCPESGSDPSTQNRGFI